ncbi:MAG: TldD/PmbA family protein, partial [Desulfarculus sp.]|nr:TldD/PmbA family protein [Desulfarculus sp.]
MSLELEAAPILEAALAKAGQMAELFLEESYGLSVVMDDNKVEKVIGGVDRGAGLRLIHDLRTAYVHTNDLSQAGLLPLAKNLAALAAGPRQALVAARRLEPGLVHQVVKAPQDVATAAKVEMVRAANAAARDVDPRVRQVRVMYLERVQEVRVVNSLGVEAWDRRAHLVMAVHCVASDNGLMQVG